MGDASPERLVVGTLGRAVGLKGEIEVRVISDDPSRFSAGSPLELEDGRVLTVRSLRAHRDRRVVAFDEIGDRTTAEAMRGRTLYVARGVVRKLDDDEFWDFDLIGCIVTWGEEQIGEVADVLHGGGGDLLLIKGASGEHLVPLVRDFVQHVDVRGRRVRINAIPGLLD